MPSPRRQARNVIEDEDDEGWEIQGERPEDIHEHPDEYWTTEAIARLLKAKGQARIQHELAVRAMNNLGEAFPDFFEMESTCPLAVDLGCGLGFSSDILINAGFVAIGIDILVDMLAMSGARDEVTTNLARARYHRVLASVTALPFREATFDLAISISALQWLLTAGERRSLAIELARASVAGAGVAIQQYARSSEELATLGSAIKAAGMAGGMRIDNPTNPRKRKTFILARKG